MYPLLRFSTPVTELPNWVSGTHFTFLTIFHHSCQNRQFLKKIIFISLLSISSIVAISILPMTQFGTQDILTILGLPLLPLQTPIPPTISTSTLPSPAPQPPAVSITAFPSAHTKHRSIPLQNISSVVAISILPKAHSRQSAPADSTGHPRRSQPHPCRPTTFTSRQISHYLHTTPTAFTDSPSNAHAISLQCISSVVAIFTFRPPHSCTPASMASSGVQALTQPTTKTPLTFASIPLSSIHQATPLTPTASPSNTLQRDNYFESLKTA